MSQFIFPFGMFLPGNELTPLQENIDKIVYGLTEWKPKMKEKGRVIPPKNVAVEGKDYTEAVAKMNNLFLRNRWGDGLAIQPATKEQVSWILTGTDFSPDTVIGKIEPVGGIATVETLAVSLAMAGGRPEYMPVLIATVKAVVDPAQGHDKWQATTNSTYPVVIVNGPVGKQIRLNSGHGCLGPDPAHPAGASIGRALRLLLQNIGGAIPGTGTMSDFGGPARYTNIVFAEDEDGSPWLPLHVERGFPRETNVVTVYSVSSTSNVNGKLADTEEQALMTLYSMAGYMRAPNRLYFQWDVSYVAGYPGVVLIGAVTAQGLAKLGWSKEKVKNFLWENSKIPWFELMMRGCGVELEKTLSCSREYWQDPMPITRKPENVVIAVAGGGSDRHNYWMQVGHGQKTTSAEIKLPANWEELLKKAEEDLGSPSPSQVRQSV